MPLIILFTALAGGFGSFLGQLLAEDTGLNSRVCRIYAACVLVLVTNFYFFADCAGPGLCSEASTCWALHVGASLIGISAGAYWIEEAKEVRWMTGVLPIFTYVAAAPISFGSLLYLTIV